MNRALLMTAALVVSASLPAQQSGGQGNGLGQFGQPRDTSGRANGVSTPAGATAAQAAAAAMGRNVTNAQIADAIRRSGLSQAQIAARLKAAGYDSTLASPFFGANGVAAPSGSGAPMSGFAEALTQIGLINKADTSVTRPDSLIEQLKRMPRYQSRPGEVFGKDIFNRTSTAFDPITAGPVDPGYRLGVGDAVQLIVTGQVELAYQMDIRRDGSVLIPQVGQVSIAGLTLDGARTVLKNRMSQSYSGLSSGEARLDLSIARIRSNAVFVIGEVEQPGAIQVNALATVFHAIARAGGPTSRGSFRGIEVRRGGQMIKKLDLYDYLLKGDATNDIRLEQGDVIFVPLATRNVTVLGEVRRPRQFELRAGEGFKDLLNFAGGFVASASTERVQVDRILPPERRQPGVERVKVDVPVKGDLDSLSRVSLLDEDIVTVFGVSELRRNVITLRGETFQTGEFEYRDKMTVGQLIARAQGLRPWALGDRIKIVRQIERTGRTQLLNVDATTAAGRDFPLAEFDEVEVLDGRLAFPAGRIFVRGAVNTPGERAYSENESLRDAIERSGGFTEDAQWIDVSRRRTGADFSDTTSVIVTMKADAAFATSPAAASFKLERDDRIFVRSSPGFRTQRIVAIAGEFKFPGEYAVNENRDRLSDLVKRAGGTLPTAYAPSFHLRRDSLDVSVDFAAAMRGDPTANILLANGDSLIIGADPRTVEVRGAVAKRTLLQYRRGLSVSDYVEMAGGPTEKGMGSKAVITYPSGMSKRLHKILWLIPTSPEVVAGSVIEVPTQPEKTSTGAEVWARVLGTTSALASLIVAYAAIKK